MGSRNRISYYDALGVKRAASLGEIRAAYKQQCRALHPDKNPYGNSLMIYINEAWAVLSDAKLRGDYDRGVDGGNHGHWGNGRERGCSADKIDSLKRELAESKQQRAMLREKLANSEQQRSRLEKSSVNLKNKIGRSQKELAESERKQLVLEKNFNMSQEKLAKSDQRLNKLSMLKKKSFDLENERSELRSKLDRSEEKLAECERKRLVLKKKIDDLKDEPSKLRSKLDMSQEKLKQIRNEADYLILNKADYFIQLALFVLVWLLYVGPSWCEVGSK